MNAKKCILATLAAFVLSNVLNTAYYMLTADAHKLPITKEQPDFILLMLNHLVFVLLLVWMYPSFAQGNAPAKEGAQFGFLMGLVMFVPTGLVVRAAWDVPMTPLFLADTVFHAMTAAVLGIVIALIYGQAKKA